MTVKEAMQIEHNLRGLVNQFCREVERSKRGQDHIADIRVVLSKVLVPMPSKYHCLYLTTRAFAKDKENERWTEKL